ncbi:hypothetical protein VTJ04DRAFT_7666 [Mycothermus thermophilus]|uniref:uncharacterized protein n=1 Tax=Humicola insolens TaxID=85995 RepID=UPI0037435828
MPPPFDFRFKLRCLWGIYRETHPVIPEGDIVDLVMDAFEDWLDDPVITKTKVKAGPSTAGSTTGTGKEKQEKNVGPLTAVSSSKHTLQCAQESPKLFLEQPAAGHLKEKGKETKEGNGKGVRKKPNTTESSLLKGKGKEKLKID